MAAVKRSFGIVLFRRREGEVEMLLLRTKDNWWDLPKGLSDPGDVDDNETAYREVFQETGCPRENCELIPDFFVRADYLSHGEWKRVELQGGVVKEDFEVKLTEHTDYMWMPLDELRSGSLVKAAKRSPAFTWSGTLSLKHKNHEMLRKVLEHTLKHWDAYFPSTQPFF